MGEFKLDQLDALSEYAVNFSNEQTHNLLKHGPNGILDTDATLSEKVKDNIRFVLNSYNGVYFFDSNPDYDNDNSKVIAVDTKTDNGVLGISDDSLRNVADVTLAANREYDGVTLRQLYPSLRMNAVLEAIEQKEWYQDAPKLIFSRGLDENGVPTANPDNVETGAEHFFSTDVWKDAYFLMKTKGANVSSGGVIEWANVWDRHTSDGHGQGNSKYLVNIEPYRTNFNNNQTYYLYIAAVTTSTNRWRIRLVDDKSGDELYNTNWRTGDFVENTTSSLYVDGSSFFSGLNQTDVTDIINTSENVTVEVGDDTVAAYGPLDSSIQRGDSGQKFWKFYIDSEDDVPMQLSSLKITLVEAEQDKDFAEKFTNTIYYYNNEVEELDIGKTSIPEMKVADWFNGIIKMFNLVAYYSRDDDGNRLIVVDTLDNFYKNGETIDLTPWVDNLEYTIEAPKAYSDIKFIHEEPSTFLAKEFKETNTEAYGDLEFDLRVDEEGNLVAPFLPKNSYEIKLPFERPVLGDINKGDPNNPSITLGLFYCLMVDDSYVDTDIKPIVHYISNKTIGGSVGILYKDESGNKVTVTNSQDYNHMTPFYRNSDDLVIQSLNYGIENDISSDLVATNVDDENTLFKNYWRNYILQSFRAKAYLCSFKSKLPQSILSRLDLGDTVIIGDNSYRFNEFSTNIIDGRNKLQLVSLNDPSLSFRQSAGQQSSDGASTNTIVFDSFSVAPSNIFTADDTQVVFTVVVSGGNGPLVYSWYKDGDLITGATETTYTETTLEDDATYYVEVTDGTFTRASETINLIEDLDLISSISVSDTTIDADGQTVTLTIAGEENTQFSLDLVEASPVNWITTSIFNGYFFDDDDITLDSGDIDDSDLGAVSNLVLIDNGSSDNVILTKWDETVFGGTFTEATTSDYVITNTYEPDNPFRIPNSSAAEWVEDDPDYNTNVDSITHDSQYPQWLIDLAIGNEGDRYYYNTSTWTGDNTNEFLKFEKGVQSSRDHVLDSTGTVDVRLKVPNNKIGEDGTFKIRATNEVAHTNIHETDTITQSSTSNLTLYNDDLVVLRGGDNLELKE